ncbi:MAG: NAD(P)-binding protein [Verrucomicrobiaceae bacterium]|nr:NAD(P)-binding protein [Verrucomicrobiaceae bacterium]
MSDLPPEPSRTPVAIVGAGPTGLSLALALARLGVRSVVLEKRSAPGIHSKAVGIHVRTREYFRLWGIEETFLREGTLLPDFILRNAAAGGKPLLSFRFPLLEKEADTPGLLVLEQSETERLLLAAVEATGLCEVLFDAEVVELSQRDSGVALRRREGGPPLQADFVVGCDGAASFVRHALGLAFEGATYSLRPMLADVRLRDERDQLPWPRVFSASRGLSFSLRIRPGLWRIVHLARREPESDEVSEEEVGDRVEELLGPGPAEIVWASRFRIHRRASPRFREGRVLLAGDAAHIHSPVGGQGMNAGVQDAANLAWKLAAALRGGDRERLLDSYDVERRAVVVEHVSRFTDFLTKVFMQAPAPLRGAALLLFRAVLACPRTRKTILRRMSMIGSDYPASPLLDAHESAAGLRLPNPLLHGSDGDNGVRLYNLIAPGAVLLDVAEKRPFLTEPPIPQVLRIGPGEWRDPSGLLRGILGGRDGYLLVRPDAHIAWARWDAEGIAEATRRALGEG